MRQRFYSTGIASLACAWTSVCAEEQAAAPVMDVVVVSASRNEHSSFNLPAAIDVIDAQGIGAGRMRVNASESLAAVPGLVALNRQNYAQDLQISSRGFGARSAFGVRGVRLLSDGIPATMPDGQGQAATFNLDMAERIEVLRGPFSALYGNHAGGVIQLFTKDGEGAPSLQLNVAGGSAGTRKYDISAQGKPGAVAYVLDASRFQTDGERSHSAAAREQFFAKIGVAPSATSKLTLVANSLRQADTQDPLGVGWASFQRDPRGAEIDPGDTQTPARSYAERYNTRKSIDHQQLGAAFEQRLGADRLRLALHAGQRRVLQYQAFSKAFQAPASHSGGVLDFARDFYGADLNWLSVHPLAGGSLNTTVGIDYGRSSDARRGLENFIGTQLGVQGRLRRDEDDVVASFAPYLQTEWQRGRWLIGAGLRYSRVDVRVSDRFIGNGDDGGAVRYRHGTPLLNALYKMTPRLNLYLSAARGFETPTLNELFYSGTGGGFNFALQAARSTHVEAGAKALIGASTRINAALFQVRTSDELVVDSANGGRTSYRNAGATLRRGVELSLDTKWDKNLSARVALSGLRAVYATAFGNVAAGKRLPGVPSARLYGELAWKDSKDQVGATVEAIASAKLYTEDSNTEIPAPAYGVVNLHVHGKQRWAGWRFQQFARVDNLLGRVYIGSVIVGDSNKRFYEAAPGRNFILGLNAQYQF